MSVETDRATVDEYSLDGIPHEVVSFAFDQLPERVAEVATSEEGDRVIGEDVGLDYNEKRVYLHQTLIGEALQKACLEKLQDMQREVERGERDDFTYEDIRRFRTIVGNRFN